MNAPGSDPGQAQWWMDPAIAKLAFGASAAASASSSAAFDSDRIELDLADPEQRRLGEFELLELIGEGGMGLVYRALQTHLQREVAVKLLSAGPWASPAYIERFQLEARHAAKLQHPAIVTVHELGELDGLVYYAMQLVRGESLAEALKRRGGKLPAREAAALMRTVAEAVEYAHSLGVLHLDLKPANILLGEEGQPRVADFGLSRFMEPGTRLDNLQTAGTPSYMAPEQASTDGAMISRATDVWGLGAILYELLCGQPPFESADASTTILLLREGVIRRPSRYAPMSPDLEAICLKCLARDPQDRYPTARALAEDLGRFLEGREVSVRRLNPGQRLLRWTRREPKLAGASALAVLALVAGLAATTHQWQRAETSATAAREQTWLTRADAAWRLLGAGRSVEAMPLLVENLREREAQGDARGVALEQLRLVTLQHTGAQLVDAIATGVTGRALTLDRSGSRVASIGLDESLHLYDTRDGRLRWSTSVASATHFRATGMPLTRVDFTTDGRHLITATMEPPTFVRPHGRNNVLVDARDGRILVVPEDVFPLFMDATYSGDGSHALLRSRDGQAQLFRVDGWKPVSSRQPAPSLGGSWRVGDGGRFVARSINHRLELLDPRDLQPSFSHQFEPAEGMAHWAAQPGGELLALGNVDGTVWLLDSTRPGLRRLQPGPAEAIDTLSFSDDGHWLVGAGGGRVYLWDVASGAGSTLPASREILPTRLQADAATGTVFAFAANDALLWQLGEAGDGGLPGRIATATMPVSQFAFGPSLPRNAGAYAPSAALIANLERNGEIRLWRWRPQHMLAARGPAQTSDTLHFDGRHVVTVAGSQVQVVDVADERPVAAALPHPQAVSFAALVPDGQGLVTVAGRSLRVFDWRQARLRFAPVLFAESPLRVSLSPGGAVLVATTGGYRDNAFKEFATSIDLRTGAVLARAVPLPGMLGGLRFDADGQRIVHWRHGVAEIRDARTLAPIGKPLRFGPDIEARLRIAEAPLPAQMAGATPVLDAAFTHNGRGLTLLLSGSEPNRPQLIEFDLASGQTRSARALDHGVIARLWTHAGGSDLAILRPLDSKWVDGNGQDRALPHASGDPHFGQALSPDARWFATAFSGGVLLADRDSGQWATAPLPHLLSPGDAIVQLSFATDGSRLLARSRLGRWAWWPLRPEPDAMARLLARMDLQIPSAGTGDALAQPLPDELRARLRGEDPGTPRPPALAATPPPDERAAVAALYRPLDLQPATTRPLDAPGLLGGASPAVLASLPRGMQRFHGVDYRIDGVVALRMAEAPQAASYPRASKELPLPTTHVAAMHLLMGGCCPLPAQARAAYAYLVLRYRDGSRARIPVLHHRHMWHAEPSNGALPARLGWIDASPGFTHEGWIQLYSVRLPNPHPERPLAGVAFEASEFFASGPLIVAATAETQSQAGAAPGSRSQ